MSSTPNKPALVATTLAGGLLLAGSAFAATPLAQGYMLGAAQDAATPTEAKAHEGGCGAKKAEGSCGMDKMDTDKDGKISPAEFGAAHGGDTSKFAQHDPNGDGFVDAAEMDAHHAARQDGMKAGKAGMEGKCGEGKCGGSK